MERIDKVRRFRLGEIPAKGKPDTPQNKKRNEQTITLASIPVHFHVENMPEKPYLVLPEVSSQKRYYIPFGYCGQEILCSNLVKIVPGASLYHFGVLSSLMHMTWVRFVAGRLRADIRYSIKLVYNNYPWPSDVSLKQRIRIEDASQSILDTRSMHSDCSLADLYDPNTMPHDLLKAHRTLDRAVDESYRKEPFKVDRDRIQFLFHLYETVVKRKEEKAESRLISDC